ncbi:MAG: hypothetical protein HQL44_17120 [Alphaproteobacteria bacterium]|nr:hypothetical protein [Alphaproteobacteria bacterium]
MSHRTSIDPYRRGWDEAKQELAAAKARIAELEAERNEAYLALAVCSPPERTGFPLPWTEHIIKKARAFVEGERKEAREG